MALSYLRVALLLGFHLTGGIQAFLTTGAGIVRVSPWQSPVAVLSPPSHARSNSCCADTGPVPFVEGPRLPRRLVLLAQGVALDRLHHALLPIVVLATSKRTQQLAAAGVW